MFRLQSQIETTIKMNLIRNLSNNSSLLSPIQEGSYQLLQGEVQICYVLNGQTYLLQGIAAPAVLLITDFDLELKIYQLSTCSFSYIASFEQDLECDVETHNVWNVNELIHQLKSVTRMMHHLVANASNEFIQDLIHFGQFVQLDSGRRLFQQGEDSDSVYFLINGRLDAYIEGIEPIVVGHIARGEIFGEMGVLSGSPRSTSIRASRHSELLKIPSEDFTGLQSKYPKLNDFITTTLIQRLDNQNRKIKAQQKPLTRIILPLVDHLTDDLNWLKCGLRRASGFIQESDVLAEFGCGELNHVHATRLYNFLDRVEQQQHCCTYWCEEAGQDWLHLALSRADEIWLVTDNVTLSQSSEQTLKDLSVDPRWHALERVLVRSHISLNTITGTSTYLDKFDCQRCFHYQLDGYASKQRVLRFLSNQAVGLVLGGGGARGIAHIGLYQALQEEQIDVDAVGGTSIGSIMAATMANQWSTEAILQHIKSHFVDINPLGDYTFPFVAISKGRRLNKALKTVFGETNIEDLPIPFYCVSANISDSSEKVHTRGKLWKAVRASLAIPGVIAPAIFEGEFYVDGGLINNLPTNVMPELKVGKILAHDVSDNEELVCDISRVPSGWPYLWHKFSKKPAKVPSILEVLFRSTLLAGVKRTNENIALADVYVKPDLSCFGMLEFKKANDIYNKGYQHCLTHLDISLLVGEK